MSTRKTLLPLAVVSAVALSLSAVAGAQTVGNPFAMQTVNGQLTTVSQTMTGKTMEGGCSKTMEGHCTSPAMIKAHGGKCGAQFMGQHKPG
ncbi:MAG: hypothetical protein ACYCXG_11910 [Acidiferrobacter sp.]